MSYKSGSDYRRDDRYSLRWSKKIKAVNALGGKCVKCGVDDIFVVLGSLKEATINKADTIHSKQQDDERAGEQNQKSEPTLS